MTSKPRQGSLAIMETRSSVIVRFMFNPERISKRTGWNHGSAELPGRSHPMYGGGSGVGELFRFLLELDADRGNFDRRRREYPNGGDVDHFFNTQVSGVEDLRPYIDYLTQFTRPQDSATNPLGGYGVPPRIFLDLGSAIRGEIGVDLIEEETFHFGPTLNILQASLYVTGHIISSSNITNSLLTQRYSGAGSNLPDLVADDFRSNPLPDVTGF